MFFSVQVKECSSNEKYENVTLQLIELISTSFIKAIEEKHLKGMGWSINFVCNLEISNYLNLISCTAFYHITPHKTLYGSNFLFFSSLSSCSMGRRTRLAAHSIPCPARIRTITTTVHGNCYVLHRVDTSQ